MFHQLILNHNYVSKLQKALSTDNISEVNNIFNKLKEKKWNMKKFVMTPTFEGLPLLFFVESPEAAKILLEHGADPLKEYPWGEQNQGLSWYEKTKKQPNYLLLSIEYGANFDLNKLYVYELVSYVKDEFLDVLKVLHKNGLDLNHKYTEDDRNYRAGNTLLMCAARNNAAKLGAWLIDNGTKIKGLDIDITRRRFGDIDLLYNKEISLAINAESYDFLDMLCTKYSEPEDLGRLYKMIELSQTDKTKKEIALERFKPIMEKVLLTNLLPVPTISTIEEVKEDIKKQSAQNILDASSNFADLTKSQAVKKRHPHKI